METWAWLLAYVVGFGLLQLVLYHHFRRNDATPNSPGSSGEAGGQHAVDRGAERAGEEIPDEPVRYCQHCGARNEGFATVRYCRECVNPL